MSDNDPKHWNRRAAEIQAAAERMKDPTCRAIMLEIAHRYDVLAARAAKRLAKWKSKLVSE
jgi:hypothetical protein